MLARIYYLLHLNSLKRRIRFWFIFLILLFVLLSSLPFLIYGKQFREEEAQDNIQQMINLQQIVIDKWFDERMSNIRTISQLPTVRAGQKEKLKQVLETFDTNETEFTGIVFVNKHGVSEIDTTGPIGIDLSDRHYFLEAKKGNSNITDVLIGRQSNQAIIIFSSPVFDYQQRFQGLIFGAVQLHTINGVMKNFRFSETGQTYLVNRDGLLLTELRFSGQPNQEATKNSFGKKIDTEIFLQAIQGKTVNHSYQDYRGTTVLGDYRWVNDHKWLIIGEIAKTDVLSPFYQMMMLFTGAFIIVLIMGIGFEFLISRQVQFPINEVLKGARQMGIAKFDYRIEPSSFIHFSNELQELCDTFNRMAEMIQYHIHSVQKSEERYRALVEHSPNAIVVHQGGNIVYVNPACIRLLRASSNADLLGRKLIEYVHPEYRELVRERIQRLQSNKSVGLLEEKYVLMDGSILDVEVIASPIEYMDQPASQIIIHDISVRKAMERELQKVQEQYRSVVENVNEVIFQTDAQGRWTFLNPAWEEITGYSIEESLRNLVLDYVHPDDRERNNQLFQPLIERKKEYFRHEIRFLTKAGGFRWSEIFARLTLNDQGQMIGTSGSLNDITLRKEAEEELRTSEERFRMLAEYSSDMITLHDAKGKFLYTSPACKEILQYDEEELVGQNFYQIIHPDDQEIIRKHHKTLLKTGYTVSTYRIRRKDGEYVWFESSIKILLGADSNDLQLIVVSRNINERKLAEERLQEANEILLRLSSIDGLTGVSNRRAFDERLEMEWNRSLRNSTHLSLIMLDIDYFKAYNDTYGHQGGDGCLKQVASVIQDTLGRSTDLLCRYGGEEFGVILPETNEAGAMKVGEKIRSAIEALEIPHAGSKIHHVVTISVGTATIIPSLYTSFMDLIAYADKAVYQAKKDGRNCVRSYE